MGKWLANLLGCHVTEEERSRHAEATEKQRKNLHNAHAEFFLELSKNIPKPNARKDSHDD